MRKYLFLIIYLFIGFFLILFFHFNSFLYHDEILKVSHIDYVSEDYDSNDLGLQEKVYSLNITGTLLNGQNKGNIIHLPYQYSYSEIVFEKIRVGDCLILKNGEIDSLKRDSYFVFLIWILILLLYLVGRFRGLLSFASVIGNSILFILNLFLYKKGVNLLLLTIISSLLYTVLSLLAAVGWNRKTFSSIVSVFITIIFLFSFILFLAFVTGFHGVNFNILSYLTVPPEEVFVAGLLISGLGAVMDVCITICSSVFEIYQTSPSITIQGIMNSVRQISIDIVPTMINVLFFTFFCSELPLFVLAIRNGFSVYNYFTTFYSLEIMKFLTGGIAICLAIPVSTFVSLSFQKKEGSI